MSYSMSIFDISKRTAVAIVIAAAVVPLPINAAVHNKFSSIPRLTPGVNLESSLTLSQRGQISSRDAGMVHEHGAPYGDNPSNGPFVKVFHTEREYLGNKSHYDENTEGLNIIVKNHANYTIYLEGSNWKVDGQLTINHPMHRVNESRLALAPGAYVLYGNTALWYNNGTYSLRMLAHTGCDEVTGDCASSPANLVGANGHKPGVVHTLFEATTHAGKWHTDTMHGRTVAFDVSAVDGISISALAHLENVNACSPMGCTAPPLGWCPIQNQYTYDDGNGNTLTGCASDCKLHETDETCCRGAFGDPQICPPSSQFLKAKCPNTYSYAYDDLTGSKECEETKTMFVHFGVETDQEWWTTDENLNLLPENVEFLQGLVGETKVAESLNTKDSKPEQPQRSAPSEQEHQPEEHQPAEPQSAESQPAEPQPAESQPAEPQPAEPQPAEPQLVEPQPAEPQLVEPQLAEPQLAEPLPEKPQPEQTQAPQPHQPEQSEEHHTEQTKVHQSEPVKEELHCRRSEIECKKPNPAPVAHDLSGNAVLFAAIMATILGYYI